MNHERAISAVCWTKLVKYCSLPTKWYNNSPFLSRHVDIMLATFWSHVVHVNMTVMMYK